MKLLTTEQIKHLDRFTIENEPISSVDLMNRAGAVLFEELLQLLDYKQPVVIFCGPGNNGGDGLVIHRLLKLAGFSVQTYLVPFANLTDECQEQFDQVKGDVLLWSEKSTVNLTHDTVIVDALLGIGSNREPQGLLKSAIDWINSNENKVYSIDMPSGLAADELPEHVTIVKATETWTIHAPKLTFMLPEAQQFIGNWKCFNIGLDTNEYNSITSRYNYLLQENIESILPIRPRFSHKGNYGHGLLIAGSDGKMGACLLSTEAAIRSGLGLLSVHTVSQGKHCLHQRIPEAMAIWDKNEKEISGEAIPDLSRFSAVGIGPGLGMSDGVLTALKQVLLSKRPCVIDADALNVLAENEELLAYLHEACVLTPHPKEFERLAGSFINSQDRLDRAIHFAQAYSCQLILKDTISAVITSKGKVSFNSTGNSGMAKGGSGDVLTGIVLGLLTQGISATDSAQIAMFCHGKAGDDAAKKMGQYAMLASDIITELRIESV